MSLQGSSDQALMRAWLEQVPRNKKILASKIYVSVVNNKNNNSNKNKNKVPKSKLKHPYSKQSKSSIKRTIRIMKNQRISEYVADTKTSFPTHHHEDNTFGDYYKNKDKNVIRIWYTNPCGIGINHASTKSHGSLHFLKYKSRADLIGLAETNVNWTMLNHSNSFYNRIKNKWREFRTVTSHNVTEKMGRCQRGGTCMFVVNQVSHRMTTSGKDNRGLGRWTWMEFQGQSNHRTRVITAYRPGMKPHSSKLTTVYDQHMRYIRKKSLSTTPRELFDKDIQHELEDLIKKDINVILMIDVNEDINNGTFTRMMQNLNLQNSFQSYLRKPIPPTHHKGSVPISAIYISPSLSISKAGILSKGIGVQGDHRNMFLDITISSFLGAPMYKVEPPQIKLLKLNDPRIYKKFIKYSKNHYSSTGLQKKIDELIQAVKTGSKDSKAIKKEQEVIDEQLGRGIQRGIHKCRKIYSGEIPYSSIFHELLKEKRLWLLVLKKKLGQKVSNKTIRRLAKGVQVENPMSLPIPVIKVNLKEAELKYISFIPHAPTERQRFYEDLASANAADGNGTKASILKRIMNTESARENGKQMSRFFPKRGLSNRVNRVTYTSNDTNKEATDPDDIVQRIQEETKVKYTSSHDSPMMHPVIHKKMGNYAETKWSRAIQTGDIPYPPMFNPWVCKIMDKLQIQNEVDIQPSEMTETEIKSVWKSIKEKKASSWSGRYNAVYKALCLDPQLLKILTGSMNLPFLSGIAYNRWYTFLDIMSFKKQNSIHVSSLRTIIISEADWNASGKVFVTRRMMKDAERNNRLPPEHLGGRKGKKSTDGGLTKRLILDNARLLNRPMAIISTDAANCYDRMLHKIIAMASMKWGIPNQVIKPLLAPLHHAKHFTRTAYGDSLRYFSGDNLQGAGQGNTGAAPFWTMISTHMIEVMKDMQFHSKFISPITKEEIILSLIAFVDDTELFLTDPNNNLQHLVAKAQEAINTWRHLLQVTGGAMRPEKCAWTMMRFDSRKNRTQHCITIPGDANEPVSIQQYSEKDPRQYLGILQRTDGKEKDQIEALLNTIEKWNTRMSSSRLFPSQNLKATLSKVS